MSEPVNEEELMSSNEPGQSRPPDPAAEQQAEQAVQDDAVHQQVLAIMRARQQPPQYQQLAQRAYENEMMSVADENGVDKANDWTLLRPDLQPDQRGTLQKGIDHAARFLNAGARGAMHGWNGVTRFVARAERAVESPFVDLSVNQGWMTKDERNTWRLNHYPDFAQVGPNGERNDAALAVGYEGELFGIHNPRLTFSEKWMDETLGKSTGVYGVLEGLTEFAVNWKAAGNILKGGQVLTGLSKVEGLTKVATALDKTWYGQGALRSGFIATQFQDVRAPRVSTYIDELGEVPKDAWWRFAAIPVKRAAGALKPDADDGAARANFKAVLEDYLLGIPFAAAGAFFHGNLERVANLRALKQLTEEDAKAMEAEAAKEYGDALAADMLKANTEFAQGMHDSQSGLFKVYRRELGEMLPQGPQAPNPLASLPQGEKGALEGLSGFNKEAANAAQAANDDAETLIGKGMMSGNGAKRRLIEMIPSARRADNSIDDALHEEGKKILAYIQSLGDEDAKRVYNQLADKPKEEGIAALRDEVGKPPAERGVTPANGDVEVYPRPEAPKNALGELQGQRIPQPESGLEGVKKAQAGVQPPPTELKGLDFRTYGEAAAAKAAINQHARLFEAAMKPLTEEQLGAIKKSLAGYKNGVDERTLEQVMRDTGINEKYLASGEHARDIIKAIADVMPEVPDGARAKTIEWAQTLFGARKIGTDPADMGAMLARFGAETKQGPQIITAARTFMALQQKELQRLSKLMAMYPGNEAIETMFVKGIESLKGVYGLLVGANANVGRTLQVNKIPEVQLIENAAKEAASGVKTVGEAAPKAAKEVAPAVNKEAQSAAKDAAALQKAEAEGKLARTSGGGVALAQPMSREDALALGQLIVRNKYARIDDVLKLIVNPGVDEVKRLKLPPNALQKAVDRIFGARVSFMLSAPVTHTAQVVGSMLKMASQPLELAWYAGRNFDGEAALKSWDLMAGMTSNIFDAVKMAAMTFNEGRSFLEAGNGHSTIGEATHHMDMLPLKDLAHPVNEMMKAGETTGSAGEAVKAFATGLWKPVDILYRLSDRALQAEDEFFKQLTYRSNVRAEILAGLREENALRPLANKLSGKEIAERLERGMAVSIGPDGRGVYADAIEQARRVTFTNDMHNTGQKFKDLVDSNRFFKFMFPFVRAPYNIFDNVWQLTPGLNLFNKNMMEDIAAGGVRAQQAQARSEMGAMLYAIGGYLAATNQITGRGPSDPAKAKYMKDMGRPQWSQKIVDSDTGKEQWVSYRREDPYMTHLGLIADLWQISGELDEREHNELASAIMASIASNAMSRSYMGNVEEVLSSIQKGKIEQAGQMALQSFVPALLDKANPDPFVREVRGWMDSVYSRMPGFSEELEMHRNVFGQPVLKPPGVGNRMANFATIMGDVQNEGLAAEMVKLGKYMSDPEETLADGQINLKDREYFGRDRPIYAGKLGQSPYDRWGEIMATLRNSEGETLAQQMDRLVRTEKWQKLPGDSAYAPGGLKFKEASKLILKFRKAAFNMMLSEYPSLQKAIKAEKQIEATGTMGKAAARQKAKELRDLGELMHRGY